MRPKPTPKPDEAKPKMPGAVPTNRHTLIPTDFGPASACFDHDPKLVNCEKAQQRKPWVFRFVGPGPGCSGGPREIPQGPPWAFPESPGPPQGPPGPSTNQSKTPRNPKVLIKRSRCCASKPKEHVLHTKTRPLNRALQKVWVFGFRDPGPGEGPGATGRPPR